MSTTRCRAFGTSGRTCHLGSTGRSSRRWRRTIRTALPRWTSSAPIHLRGVGAFDPQGDNSEHDADAPKATDGNTATFWTTEHYNDGLQKPGVGVVLDAGRTVSPKTVRVTTDTDGFTAVIRAGGSRDGPFTSVSPSEHVTGTTSFPIRGGGRYFLVWITDLGSNS